MLLANVLPAPKIVDDGSHRYIIILRTETSISREIIN